MMSQAPRLKRHTRHQEHTQKKLAVLSILIALVYGFGIEQPARAQPEEELKLNMSRDLGYGGFGEIQGLFSLSVGGPENLERVAFMIDGEIIGEDAEPPFRLQFNTDNYPVGQRTLSAVGYTSDGRELQANEIQIRFVSAEKARQVVFTFIVPVVVLLGVIIVLVLASTVRTARKRGGVPLGQPRKYGVSGGAICPKCERPFPLRLLSVNLLTRQLTPCPHCGKWVIVGARPLAELRAAEAAELERIQATTRVTELSDEEKLRRQLEESRYQDV
jgi:hypothetical protein